MLIFYCCIAPIAICPLVHLPTSDAHVAQVSELTNITTSLNRQLKAVKEEAQMMEERIDELTGELADVKIDKDALVAKSAMCELLILALENKNSSALTPLRATPLKQKVLSLEARLQQFENMAEEDGQLGIAIATIKAQLMVNKGRKNVSLSPRILPLISSILFPSSSPTPLLTSPNTLFLITYSPSFYLHPCSHPLFLPSFIINKGNHGSETTVSTVEATEGGSEELSFTDDDETTTPSKSSSTQYPWSSLHRLGEVFGTGTFGRVCLVQQQSTQRIYALKTMRKSDIVAHKQQHNVLNERNILMSCNHPFILRLYQTFRDPKKLYMLLEFVQGGELFSAIHANKIEGGFTEVHAKFYAAGIVLALGTG